ncbi:MAG: 2-oxo-4-hydroxy-4-carboxy-5-ureidoimidazoline decarboxylase [Armatimonadota bacterium]|nr:2-oxo-4-hydroxy-4-carboxy-5-ureidoimidazoline decarboxylase [Armatimonadota bacterium]MDR7401740.1 2-oxo-4-hydroxy-4-carboxy-5-ureidoimidazoline decarboxylase [Armatimonadota bacterium]MDR7404132.1 2-oxo-4-hydroxy-4-carboxy-5-ureidoimidazoline decarboxylase [Armatimonadota bacterium]MDR7436257.1 2-oxo-4-hydroxy-4-carboxy-5-ureidoimidazoline decarboxylase [Armatimonadota bacterium]MDR7471363.1 2-oxo-4-hydroxy-4-carboxy-5-ureidoimidazoline decarboxylase [Armatimonadota bacterium]
MARLTIDELAALFEGRTRFTERLAALEDPLERAADVLRSLPEEEVLEALNAHPRIGERPASSAAAAEQGTEDDPLVLAELAALNAAYEARFGFRFVVFVNRRPRSQIIPVLRERLQRTREEELATAIEELVAIARERHRRREEGRGKKEEGDDRIGAAPA